MRYVLTGVMLAASLAVGAVSALTTVAAESVDSALLTQGLGTLGVGSQITTSPALDPGDPLFKFPYSPFCPNGPQGSNCFLDH